MKAILAIGFANGWPCPHAGMYLKSADFEAGNGRGHMEFTPRIQRAMKFNDAAEALRLWRTQSQVRPLRPDGEPNRPLTALTVEIVDVP